MKGFRQLIKALDRYLGQFYSELTILQKELMTIYPKLDQDLKSNINAVIMNAGVMREQCEDQVHALQTLQIAPPGMVASVVDFLYSIFIDPNAKTRKQEYQEKLSKINRSFVLQMVHEGEHSMGLSPGHFNSELIRIAKFFRSKSSQQAEDLYKVLNMAAAATKVTHDPYSPRITPQQAAGELSKLVKDASEFQTIVQAFSKQLVEALPKQPIDTYQKNAKRIVNVASQMKYIPNAPAHVQSAVHDTLLIRIAEINSIVQKLQKWQSLLTARYNQMKLFVNDAAQQRAQSKGSQPADVDMALRYYNYIDSLLSTTHTNSMSSELNRLIGLLKQSIDSVKSDEGLSEQFKPKSTKLEVALPEATLEEEPEQVDKTGLLMLHKIYADDHTIHNAVEKLFRAELKGDLNEHLIADILKQYTPIQQQQILYYWKQKHAEEKDLSRSTSPVAAYERLEDDEIDNMKYTIDTVGMANRKFKIILNSLQKSRRH